MAGLKKRARKRKLLQALGKIDLLTDSSKGGKNKDMMLSRKMLKGESHVRVQSRGAYQQA